MITNAKHGTNIHEVASGIYRGSQPQGPDGWASLRKLGVKTVINLRTLHSEHDDVIAAGLAPVEVPLIADLRGSRPPKDPSHVTESPPNCLIASSKVSRVRSEGFSNSRLR